MKRWKKEEKTRWWWKYYIAHPKIGEIELTMLFAATALQQQHRHNSKYTIYYYYSTIYTIYILYNYSM